MKIYYSALTISVILSVLSFPSKAQDIQLVTENLAPYNYRDNDKLKGISAEIVLEILKHIPNKSASIKTYPFKRAMAMAKSKPNTLIFSIIRTKEREEDFVWIGTLAPITAALFRLAKREDVHIQNLNDLKNFQISDIQGSAIWEYLKGHGIKTHEVPTTRQNIKLLKLGRIDLVGSAELNFYHVAREMGYPDTDFELAYVFQNLTKDLWLAMNVDSDREVIKQFKQSMKRVKNSDTYNKILIKYHQTIYAPSQENKNLN